MRKYIYILTISVLTLGVSTDLIAQSGCTDVVACNYNASAVTDDGSCIYSPNNDECATAASLVQGGQLEGTNVCSSQNGISPFCFLDGVQNDVWYSIVAPSNGKVVITCSSGGADPMSDTQIALYVNCGDTDAIYCDDDSGDGDHGKIEIDCSELTPGNTYYVQVDGFNGDAGTFLIAYDVEDVVGCTDVNAANYNACATIDDGSCNENGCTDMAACNFNANADVDDGSCCYSNCVTLHVSAGLYPTEISYVLEDLAGTDFIVGSQGSAAPKRSTACIPDGCYRLVLNDLFGDGWNGATYSLRLSTGAIIESGTFENDLVYGAFQKVLTFSLGSSVPGCTNPIACNYDPTATCDDGTCDLESCFGCLDPAACNYDDQAISDDGSCCYDNCVTLELYDLSSDGWDVGSYTVYGAGDVVVATGTMPTGTDYYAVNLCLEEGCYYIMVDPGDFPEEISYILSGDSPTVIFGDGNTTGPQYYSVGDNVCLGCKTPTACNYSPNAVFDSGDCILGPCVLGDNPWNAINLTLGTVAACRTLTDTHVGATVTSVASSYATTGEDIWYRFVAPTSGVKLTVTSATQDLVLELLDATYNSVNEENMVYSTGTESLNFNGLTPGAVYFLGVRDFDSADGLASYNLCLSYLLRTGCNTGTGANTLCGQFKANFVGCDQYVFRFLSQTSGLEYTHTQPGSLSRITLAQVPNLQWNDNYTVTIDAVWRLTDGAGNVETFVLPSATSCTVNVAPAPPMAVRSSFSCASAPSLSRNTTIIADPWICGSIGAEWEFTDQNGITPVFTATTMNTDRRIRLNTVPQVLNGRTYNVRVRPIYSYGVGTYGPAVCISIAASGMVLSQEDEAVVEYRTVNIPQWQQDLAVYPNPNDGSTIFVTLNGEEDSSTQLIVRDELGRIIQNRLISTDVDQTIDLQFQTQLADGIYHITLVRNDQTITKHVVVQKQ